MKKQKKQNKTEKQNNGFWIRKADYFDYTLLLVLIVLISFGLVMLYSASAYNAQNSQGDDMFYFTKQAIISAGGLLLAYVVSRINYHIYGVLSRGLYLLSMALMALVRFTPLGITVNGARRWLGIPGSSLSFQPSEMMKLAIILFIPYELCRIGKGINTRWGMMRVALYGGVAAAGVMFLTDNLSTAVIVFLIPCVLFFVAHPKTRQFILALAGGGAVLVGVLYFLLKHFSSSDNFRLQRILVWLSPEDNLSEGGYQVLQGLYAIGSGGFWGKGLGNSAQKLGIIPEAQNDMIFSIICEELGVFGAIFVLLLFGFLLYRLMHIAQNAPDMYGFLIAVGIFSHIAIQVVLNIAVVTNLIPTTGITLPFISYGGTSILFLMVEMGVALGISRTIHLGVSEEA